DDLRRSPAAPNMTPPSNAKLAVAKLKSLMAPWWQMESGTLGNASALDPGQVRAAGFMHGQALLEAASFGLGLNSDYRIKIICMRNETVNAALPPRVSQKKAARQVQEGRLSKISCQCIPELLPVWLAERRQPKYESYVLVTFWPLFW